MEIRLNGFNGVAFSVQSNQFGLVGANGRSLDAQGASGYCPAYDIFLNPPDLASYSVIIPRASDPSFNAGSGDVECALIEPGLNIGYFEFVSNVDGGYKLTCDLNGDEQFVATSDRTHLAR
ncbi:MAG: hypothetical protein JXR76_15065 [Deltaproteobacteria bacterium]|nr:hypothetical protein [Deltaproteobacteria bacterium]